jgi:exosortase A-associated hydrolase 2
MRVAFFLQGGAGRIFCTGSLHDPGGAQRRSALIIPPFAEEMNKSRHVLAALSKSLEAAGHDVLMPDLYGTGDSEGDFGDITLDIWRADIDATVARLNPQQGLDLVGLRTGALLAADAVSRHKVGSLTLLHPVVDGRQQLVQMLRLRLASGLMGGGEKETASQLRQRLAEGVELEIAGYRLSAQLAGDLESLALARLPPTDVERVIWIELSPQAERPLMPASQRVIDAWVSEDIAISSAVVTGDQFWATQEITQCPAIVAEAMKLFAD